MCKGICGIWVILYTGTKYSTPNWLEYTGIKAKSLTQHLATNEAFKLTFIEVFQAIYLMFAISFSIWVCTLNKKIEKSND